MEIVLEKKAVLKFGEHTQFSLTEIDNMYVPEFHWWIKKKEEFYKAISEKIKESKKSTRR